jgi:DNA polymerase-3 subunit gamma/tau
VRTATAVAQAPPLAAPARAVAPATPAAAIAPVAPAAASAAAARPASAPRPAPERPTWDEEPPPYETEYGFDPGDEPIDDEAPAVRESSEEQALRLLREHLGAERID